MTPISRYYDVLRNAQGERYISSKVQGFSLLHVPLLNKSTAFTPEEQRRLGLEGLVPPHTATLEEQKERSYHGYLRQPSDLARHEFLRALQDRNEVLFYALLHDHLQEMLPIIYTPTVGEAVREFSRLYRYPRGLVVNRDNIRRVDTLLDNVPLDDVRMIVATDSSAILGIGDQGYGGMAISIGKLSLYTAAGGVGPDKTLPVELDVGTDREDLLQDPLYLGSRHKRLTGAEYDEFLDRFVEAVAARYPKAIVQWEDFSRGAAFRVLERYRRVIPSFNDDIQGTGAMALAGMLSAARLKGETLAQQVFVVVGGGAGGIGVAQQLRAGLMYAGLSEQEAAGRIYVVGRRGLLMEGVDVRDYQRGFAKSAQDIAGWNTAGLLPTLLETIRESRSTALLGLTGTPDMFTQEMVEAVQANTPRPIIFPLSNPTANAEIQPLDALRWTGGQAIVAAGSPFADVELGGQTYPVGQGNNAFIFPGLGFGAVLSRAREITDGMIMQAAQTLADETAAYGDVVYPPVSALREVSVKVAARVMRQAITEGVAAERQVRNLSDEQLLEFVQRHFWQPHYLPIELAQEHV